MEIWGFWELFRFFCDFVCRSQESITNIYYQNVGFRTELFKIT